MTLDTYLQNHYSQTSIRSYKNTIERYCLVMGDKAEKATYTDVLQYINDLRNQNLHPKSLRNNLYAIKIYYRYLLALGKREDHPCQHLYLKDQINRQIHIENLYDKKTLEDCYNNHQAKDEKDKEKVIISLLIHQALTVLEITSLKIKSIHLEKGTITIPTTGKNRGRTLPLASRQVILFHRYIAVLPSGSGDEYLLKNKQGKPLWNGSINRIINRNRRKEDRLKPLKIRQSVIANLLKDNKDIRMVQAFAGHRRTASTEAYKQTGLEELKSAISRLHPLQ